MVTVVYLLVHVGPQKMALVMVYIKESIHRGSVRVLGCDSSIPISPRRSPEDGLGHGGGHDGPPVLIHHRDWIGGRGCCQSTLIS